MKKVIIIGLLLLTPLAGMAQSIFDKYEDMDEVSSVIVNKNMFDLLVKIDADVDDAEAREFMDIAQSLTGLKVFITEDSEVSRDMQSTVDKYLKSASLEELMRVKGKDANGKF